jgi:HEAT repeat protein
VLEVDPDGKVVWEAYTEGTPRRARVCLGLVRRGFDAPRPADLDLFSLPYRIKGLSSKDRERRWRSVLALQALGADAQEAIPALVEAMADPDDRIADEAGGALAGMGREKVFDVAVRALGDKRPKVRGGAVGLVGSFGKASRPAYETVLKLRQDDSPFVRLSSLCAIARIGGEGEEVLPSLLAGLRDPDESVQRTAIELICARGSSAAAAVPTFLDWLGRADEKKRDLAFYALRQIGSEDERAINALFKLATDEKNEVDDRVSAAYALGGMRPPPPGAVEVIADVLCATRDVRDAKAAEGMRRVLFAELRALGPRAKPAVPALASLVKDGKAETSFRVQAIEALGAVGAQAREAIPALTEASRDADLGVSLSAAEALKKIEH